MEYRDNTLDLEHLELALLKISSHRKLARSRFRIRAKLRFCTGMRDASVLQALAKLSVPERPASSAITSHISGKLQQIAGRIGVVTGNWLPRARQHQYKCVGYELS